MKLVINLLALSLLTFSCAKPSADSVKDLGFTPPPAQGNQKSYSDSNLSGKALGTDWSAKSAIARPFGVDKDKIIIEFYNEAVSKSCNTPFVKQVYASIVLPKDITQTEYTLDLRNMKGNGEALVFVDPTRSYNLMAEQTKLRVDAIDAQGFDISLYAFAIDTSMVTSEINGKMRVTYCQGN